LQLEHTAVTYHLFVPLLLAIVLAACSNQPKPSKTDPMRQASAISVTMPGFVTSPETTLRWRSDLQWADDPQGQYKRRAQVLQQALQQEFQRKGYQFVGAGAEATYDVLAIALMGRLQDKQELEDVFRLYPSLAKPAKGYGNGTVLVAIAPAGTSDIVWRGALAVFTDPGGKMPVAERDERMVWAAKKLLGNIPNQR
jgi:hypothetical protein